MTTTGNSAEPVTAPRSIISRITSPFKAKSRHVSDFYIKLDEPHRRYSPGDVVKGSVILTLQKPLRITHIVLCLHGFVRVFKSPIAPGDGIAKDGGFMGAGRGSRGTEYFGNGFASIFEDEFVLHGEARLNAATWTLGFEMEFPPAGIPSSIDFERGTISYVLTSTLTRPATLTPTITCDRKIYLVEAIDIAPLRKPKPRTITLEPILRRSRNRTSGKAALSQSSQSSANVELPSMARPPFNDAHSNQSSDRVCPSPGPSERSSTGAESSSNASFRIRSRPSVPSSSAGNEPRSSGTPTQDKTITAKIELPQGGYLAGDTIHVQISVDHTKPIVSTDGIIVTLYRQGRVDMHPALPLGPSEPGKKPQYEDYYPKSRTGLGGLSLSSAAPTKSFRMDLDQSFTPLIVDPNTLTAVVKASVRVPDNVFPTVSKTPGSMISFSYFVEVIVDLRGKLTLPERILPHLGIKDSPRMPGYSDSMTWRSVGLPDPPRSQSTNFTNTDKIRREKSVVACSVEVVMGTKDSARKGGKKNEENEERTDVQQVQIPARDVEGEEGNAAIREEQNRPDAWTPRGEHRGPNFETAQPNQDRDSYPRPQANLPPNFPLPNIPLPPESDEPLDEKARIRRAEAQLLPSAPPLDDDDDDDDEDVPSSSHMPSAPPPSALYNEFNPSLHYNDYGSPHDASPVYSHAGPSSAPPPFPDLAPTPTAQRHRPLPPDNQPIHPGEDKQELERQRLLAQESAPPLEDDGGEEEEDDGQGAEGTIPGPGTRRRRPPPDRRSYMSPSAPFLGGDDDDDDARDARDYGIGRNSQAAAGSSSSSAAYRARRTSEALPRYEK